MRPELIAIQIIFDKIIESSNIHNKETVKSKLSEIYNSINNGNFDITKIEPLFDEVNFLDENLKRNIIDLLRNLNNKKYMVSKFLRIISDLSINFLSKDSNDYKTFSDMITESDKMLLDEYNQNNEINNDIYLLSIAILQCKDDYSDVYDKVIKTYTSNDNKLFIKPFIDFIENIKKDNTKIIKDFIFNIIDVFEGIGILPKDLNKKNNENVEGSNLSSGSSKIVEIEENKDSNKLDLSSGTVEIVEIVESKDSNKLDLSSDTVEVDELDLSAKSKDSSNEELKQENDPELHLLITENPKIKEILNKYK